MKTITKVPVKETFNLSPAVERDIKPLKDIFLLDNGFKSRYGWLITGHHKKNKHTSITVERGFDSSGRWGHATYTVRIKDIQFATGGNLKEVVSNTIKLLNFKL